jgi:catechol 2,3-dioxygenase
MTQDITSNAAHPDSRIGHVHLKVSNLDQAIAFYSGILGFELQVRMGNDAAFLGAGGYHHHIGLNTWESAGAGPAPKFATGLYHTAFLFPTRKDLALAIKRVTDAGLSFTGAADHGVSEAIYLDDPDGNGVELYVDRPKADWPTDANGKIVMYNKPFDLKGVMAELDA